MNTYYVDGYEYTDADLAAPIPKDLRKKIEAAKKNRELALAASFAKTEKSE